MARKPYGIRIFYHKGTNMAKWFATPEDQDREYRKYKGRIVLPNKARGRDVKYVKKISNH